MTWHQVAKASDVPEGEAIQVRVAEAPIAIYNLGGAYYATHDICTHAQAHLSDGYIDGDCVECPLHAGVFHIPTGECRGGPVQKPVRVYPIKRQDDNLLIET